MNKIDDIRKKLHSSLESTPEKVKRFFKTAPGDYSEHDQFIGATIPTLRKIAKNFKAAELEVVQALLDSKYNEERLLGLFMLVDKYQTADANDKEKFYQFYLKNLKRVNNWNLVDASAHLIIGAHLWNKDHSLLQQLASSADLWERRIAIVATWYFTRQQDLDTTFQLAEQLLNDRHDLIHKAVGWMLREAGKRDQDRLLAFLTQHKKQMPRTMLRYAIEKLSPEQKVFYLK